MTNNLARPDMTLDEANETDRLIKHDINNILNRLLEMHDLNGWKALGYQSFVEYEDKELRIFALLESMIRREQ